MGRTSKPVYFVVESPLEETQEFIALRDEGHTVLRLGDPAVEWGKADVIVGPRCWRVMPDMLKWLPLLLKETRAKQPVKPKKTKKGINGTPASRA